MGVALIRQLAGSYAHCEDVVQAAESRATTVFAIERAMQNAEDKLKSGMPADVYFEQ